MSRENPAMDEESKTERLVADLKRRRAEVKVVEVDEEKIKLVIFTLSNEYYAFPGKNIKEILRVDKITYVPGSPDIILGIINSRGDIESVLDIHKFLGFPSSKITPASRIMIAAEEGVRSGIFVDSVEDVVDVSVGLILPPLSTLDNSLRELITGQTTYNHRNVTVLDVGKALGMLTV